MEMRRNCMELSVLVSLMSLLMAGASPISNTDVEENTELLSRTKRSHRGESHIGRLDRDPSAYAYRYACPRVKCPAVSPRCKDVESIVFEYSFYDTRGRLVDIRCESCRYCLDMPTRSRRSSRSSNRRVNSQDCPVTTCPEVPDECNNIQMTNVLFHDEYCHRCPACFDGTMLA